jgi:hypothetical protein
VEEKEKSGWQQKHLSPNKKENLSFELEDITVVAVVGALAVICVSSISAEFVFASSRGQVKFRE